MGRGVGAVKMREDEEETVKVRGEGGRGAAGSREGGEEETV